MAIGRSGDRVTNIAANGSASHASPHRWSQNAIVTGIWNGTPTRNSKVSPAAMGPRQFSCASSASHVSRRACSQASTRKEHRRPVPLCNSMRQDRRGRRHPGESAEPDLRPRTVRAVEPGLGRGRHVQGARLAVEGHVDVDVGRFDGHVERLDALVRRQDREDAIRAARCPEATSEMVAVAPTTR